MIKTTIIRRSREPVVKGVSHYSSSAIKTRPGFREIIKTPIFKSIFLTMVFGTAVVDVINKRKNLETLTQTYATKAGLLRDIILQLEKNEKIDLQRELKIANTLTEFKYNTVTDIEIDEQVEQLIRFADESMDEGENAAGDVSKSINGGQKGDSHFI